MTIATDILPRVVVLIMLGAHALQAFLFAPAMNLRTSFAIMVFAACAAFAERIADNRYAIPLLRVLGLAGMTILMIVLQLNVSPTL